MAIQSMSAAHFEAQSSRTTPQVGLLCGRLTRLRLLPSPSRRHRRERSCGHPPARPSGRRQPSTEDAGCCTLQPAMLTPRLRPRLQMPSWRLLSGPVGSCGANNSRRTTRLSGPVKTVTSPRPVLRIPVRISISAVRQCCGDCLTAETSLSSARSQVRRGRSIPVVGVPSFGSIELGRAVGMAPLSGARRPTTISHIFPTEMNTSDPLRPVGSLL